MTVDEMNKMVSIRSTKEVVRKLKLVSALRGNSETLGALVGAMVDKEMSRLGLKGNNDE